MEQNVGTNEYGSRIGIALVAGAVSACVPNTVMRAVLLALAGGLLTTVATGYCPVIAFAERRTTEAPTWRTLKTWRVEASGAADAEAARR